MADSSTAPRPRLADVMAALSLATDLGMGQPLEFALTGCVLAVRLGEALGLRGDDLRDVYYYGLLRFIGCNAETHLIAALVGDELAIRSAIAPLDAGDPAQVLPLIIRFVRQANEGASALTTVRAIARGVLSAPGFMREQFAGHCEVAQRLAERLGFGQGMRRALGQLYERWDGKGLPRGLKAEAVSPAVLLVTLAQDAVIHHRLGGLDAAVAVVRERRGRAYAPEHADLFLARAAQLMREVDANSAWEAVLACEPGRPAVLSDAEFDRACEAMADFADVKSPYTLNHSPRVADLAARAARAAGLTEAEATALRRAGLVHDIGRVGVSARIWTKDGPLTEREWEQVRLHPYYTARILARPAALARLGATAALNRERLDGTGYHRALPAAMLPPAARLLAAANVYCALTEPRPYRAAQAPERAAAILHDEARDGRLDADAVRGVLAAAGRPLTRRRPARPANLTERERAVLRLIARGLAIKEMARQLSISPKTVDTHIQHIYAKIGASTRAGATLFAVEHDLLTEMR